VNVTGTADDVGASGLSKVEIDDGGTRYLAVGANAWSYAWAPPAEPGDYTLTATATDVLGNDSAESIGVHFEPTLPTAYISWPGAGQEVIGGSLVITGSALGGGFQSYYSRHGSYCMPLKVLERGVANGLGVEESADGFRIRAPALKVPAYVAH